MGDQPHHRQNGVVYGLTPVVDQLRRWAHLVDELVVSGPVLPGPPPVGTSPLPEGATFVPIRAGGGNTWRAKLGLVARVPGWALATRRLARSVDAVALRCPSNVAAVALFATWGAVDHRVALYAGAWRSYPGEPRPYRLQRAVLRSPLFGGPVLVYAERPGPGLEKSFSPSHDRPAWAAAEPAAAALLGRIGDRRRSGPWRLLVVGRLTPNKNQVVAVEALARLVADGFDVRLDVIGDGPRRPCLERRVRELGLGDRVRFLGEVAHAEVLDRFSQADLQLLTTRGEGFGKVLLEGMVFGVVPVLADGPAAVEIAGEGRRGIVVPSDLPDRFAAEVAGLIDDRDRWVAMAVEARAYAGTRTLEAYEGNLREVLERRWGMELRPARGEGVA